ncbi:MAG: pyridoxamine 5'-phosphate oxidase family protein [Candidatus Dormibacteraeota bacterium]|nr:pyridoxamine 5'-phosphate oxidase family protein [Candidatus Dormibacteraeota bacterium]
MTKAEREEYLAGVHVGVLAVADEDGRGPLALPIWYGYQPGGEVTFVTGRPTPRGRLMQVGTRVSLCVQDEALPYRYAAVEGPVVAIDPASAEERRSLAARYLGREGAEAYLASTPELADISVIYRVRPERWRTHDFGDLGR